jgi:two-component system chemotaxis response regulator CheB
MRYKVMVVDDSTFYRRRLSAYIDEDPFLEVVAQARDGLEAIKLAKEHRPDIITMDVEMPGMNGIEAVKKIMTRTPTAIMMISSLTKENAPATLDALAAGALDFMPKNFEEISEQNTAAISKLKRRLKILARQYKQSQEQATNKSRLRVPLREREASSKVSAKSSPSLQYTKLLKSSGKQYNIVTIAASTGGPQALQQTLDKLPKHFPLPIVLIQHMPGTFTDTFAKRLDKTTKISVKLAEDGEKLVAGNAYLAPGGMQTHVIGTGQRARLSIRETSDDKSTVFSPSADITFESIADSFGHKVLAIVLTGMGDDGTKGAKILKRLGATIWAQDQASCVVYGMPKSVNKAGLVDRVIPLDFMAHDLLMELNDSTLISHLNADMDNSQPKRGGG